VGWEGLADGRNGGRDISHGEEFEVRIWIESPTGLVLSWQEFLHSEIFDQPSTLPHCIHLGACTLNVQFQYFAEGLPEDEYFGPGFWVKIADIR
jgi:hypothetical protein